MPLFGAGKERESIGKYENVLRFGGNLDEGCILCIILVTLL